MPSRSPHAEIAASSPAAARPAAAWSFSAALLRRNLPLFALYACAIYSFVRSHLVNCGQFLYLSSYLLGGERLPYQRRILPMLAVRGLERLPSFQWIEGKLNQAIVPPHLLGFFLYDLSGFVVASLFCVLLYTAATRNGRSRFFIFPIFLFCCAWTYVLPPDTNLYFPYDFASLAFFTAGLYFIYTRRFVALLVTVLLGTLNRETTLFLIPIFVLDRVVDQAVATGNKSLKALLARVPWLPSIALLAAWVLVMTYLAHQFTTNNPIDQYLRVKENSHFLLPHKWPQLLCACGFLLPVVIALQRRIPDPRIRAWLLIIPLWIAVMFVYGRIGEVRVFGELCPLVAVSSALLLDSYFDGCGARPTAA